MLQFFTWALLAIVLLVKVPIVIVKRWFKVSNYILDTVELITSFAAPPCLIGMAICGCIEQEVDTGLAVAFFVLFGGGYLFLLGAWIYVTIRGRR